MVQLHPERETLVDLKADHWEINGQKQTSTQRETVRVVTRASAAQLDCFVSIETQGRQAPRVDRHRLADRITDSHPLPPDRHHLAGVSHF
jgi:hypothetical protein